MHAGSWLEDAKRRAERLDAREIILIWIGFFLALGFTALYDAIKEFMTANGVPTSVYIAILLGIFAGAMVLCVALVLSLPEFREPEERS